MIIKKIISLVLFLIALSVLITLGSWQVQRLEWKKDIIARLEAEYRKDPLAHRYTLEDLNTENDLPLFYGSAEGVFLYDKEILLGPKPYDGSIGFLVVTPLKLNTGGYILVNRGLIEQKNIKDIGNTHGLGNVITSGVFRKPDWNNFTPDNSPENNIWTKPDIDQIAAVQGISPVAPLMLYAEKSTAASNGLIMQQEKWYPRNKHKQYAIFWFTMALVLMAVFGFYIYQGKRKPA